MASVARTTGIKAVYSSAEYIIIYTYILSTYHKIHTSYNVQEKRFCAPQFEVFLLDSTPVLPLAFMPVAMPGTKDFVNLNLRFSL
jgi:hypothetical protein